MVNETPKSEADVLVPAVSREDRAATVAPRGFAVRFSPAPSSGSWADVVPLDDGRTGVLLCHCAEPSDAERLGPQLRDALQQNGDPVASLDGVGDPSVSALCAVIDATTIAYSVRGESAIAVVAPAGRTTDERDGQPAICDLAPGSTVLLSTAPVTDAADLLGNGAALHPDHLADQVFSRTDDTRGISAVLYRHPPEPMTITLPAVTSNLAVSRGRLREWLAAAGVDRDSSADVLLAVGEATANATEHSVFAADHDVRLTVSAALSGNHLQLTVSDDGRWKPPSAPRGHRGHGTHLIKALVDSVEMTTAPGGTTVAMLKELP